MIGLPWGFRLKNLPAVQETRLDPWIGKIPRRRERLPTPVFWSGKFHGLYSPWGRKELDTTKRLSLSLSNEIALKIKRITFLFLYGSNFTS